MSWNVLPPSARGFGLTVRHTEKGHVMAAGGARVSHVAVDALEESRGDCHVFWGRCSLTSSSGDRTVAAQRLSEVGLLYEQLRKIPPKFATCVVGDAGCDFRWWNCSVLGVACERITESVGFVRCVSPKNGT